MSLQLFLENWSWWFHYHLASDCRFSWRLVESFQQRHQDIIMSFSRTLPSESFTFESWTDPDLQCLSPLNSWVLCFIIPRCDCQRFISTGPHSEVLSQITLWPAMPPGIPSVTLRNSTFSIRVFEQNTEQKSHFIWRASCTGIILTVSIATY